MWIKTETIVEWMIKFCNGLAISIFNLELPLYKYSMLEKWTHVIVNKLEVERTSEYQMQFSEEKKQTYVYSIEKYLRVCKWTE